MPGMPPRDNTSPMARGGTFQTTHWSVVLTARACVDFRLGSLWNADNQAGWHEFLRDKKQDRIVEMGVDWVKLFAEFEAAVVQHGSAAQPDLLDGMHVLAARQIGATHFVSFDYSSRQRAFARAMGLKVLPEQVPGEFDG